MTATATDLAPGTVWRNVHTGRETTILDVRPVERSMPHALAQDPRDGRLIMGDYRPVTRLHVFFEGGAPPGFDQGTQGGWSAETFLKHWTLDIGGYGGES